MTVYTPVTEHVLAQLRQQYQLPFVLELVEGVEDGSSDSCHYLRTPTDTYFLKIHEDKSTSPHGSDAPFERILDLNRFVGERSERCERLWMLTPHLTAGRVPYAHVNTGQATKTASLWPYVTPVHPDAPGVAGFSLQDYGEALAELHLLLKQHPTACDIPFERNLETVQATFARLEEASRRLPHLDDHLSALGQPGSGAVLRSLRAHLQVLHGQWAHVHRDHQVTWGCIHGEIKPSNTLIHRGRVVFIDMCKAGYAPLVLDVAMGAQAFSNRHAVDSGGIQHFLEGYMTHAQLTRNDVQVLPLMLHTAQVRLAAYRALAVAVSGPKVKDFLTPLALADTLAEGTLQGGW